ncbi:MAG: DNA recombination protein RmuC [Candidatus Doudnabacteria bacterium]|nr:DNA recombination protein RmuC [Candidatus Doudnabacteria bacterium]
MENMQFYSLLVAIAAGFAALFYYQRTSTEKPQDNEALRVMTEWMKEIKAGTEATKDTMERGIKETNKAINERLDNAGRVIAALTKELGGVSQIGPDIRRLAETMSSPKMRGNFGEEMLENLLGLVLPRTAYDTQFKFKNGEIVDATVKIGDRIISIDSKFSMENFRQYKEATTDDAAESLKKTFLRDVRKRVDEICKKYILPQEHTYDFALMFIPSEGVYIEVADDVETMRYARERKVVFVGPNTLYLTLQTFLVSLKGQQINKAAQQILSMVAGIKQESDKFQKTFDTALRHVKNASGAMDVASSDYSKLKSTIVNASNLELQAEKQETPIPVPEQEIKKLL